MSGKRIWDYLNSKGLVKDMKARSALKNLPVFPFDEADKPSGKIDKKFVRCSGKYLTQMYTDITSSPAHNYITCVDTPIHKEKIDREEFECLKISAILKTPSKDLRRVSSKIPEAERATMAELVCSRVANLLNVKTEYVAPIENNPYSCLIVDFLKNKESIENYSDFTNSHQSAYIEGFYIGGWINHLASEISARTLSAELGTEYSVGRVNSVVEDFARQYLFKKYIVHDADLCDVNIGIITTPDGDISMAPAYDFEQCLMPDIRMMQGQGLEEDLEYLVERYPHVLKNIAGDFTLDSYRKKELKEIIDRFCPNDDLKTEYYNLIVNSCLSFVTNASSILARSDEMISQ